MVFKIVRSNVWIHFTRERALNPATPYDGYSQVGQQMWALSSLPLSPPPPISSCIFFCPTRLSAWTRSCLHTGGRDSCLPCIMCPLRAPSGRWKPTSTSCRQYGKVYKHMALNRDVSGFSLNVPPTCRIWLKCNEVLVRGGRWLSWPDSHYCLVIGCQAADATLRFNPLYAKRNLMK